MIAFINNNIHYIILVGVLVKCVASSNYNDFIICCKMFIIAAANLGLKYVLGEMIPRMTTNDYILNKLVYRPGTTKSGLPSGHCMVVFSVIPPLMEIYKTEIIMLMISYGIFIAYDRVRQERHTYAQVIIGALLGWEMGIRMF